MSDPSPSALEIERRKLANDDERLRLDRSFAKTWAPAAGAVVIPVAIGLATIWLSYQQSLQAGKDNRIKQGSLCLDYFHKFDTDTTYTALDPKSRTATLETLRAIFTDFPECLNIHADAIQASYLAGGGASGTVSQDLRLAELDKILRKIGIDSGAAPTSGSPAPRPAPGEQVDRGAYQIYVHFRNEQDRSQVQAVANALVAKGWRAAPIQRVTQPTKGDVRYYKADEKQDATVLAADVQEIVAKELALPPVALTPLDISRTFPNLPTGVMEVWLADL